MAEQLKSAPELQLTRSKNGCKLRLSTYKFRREPWLRRSRPATRGGPPVAIYPPGYTDRKPTPQWGSNRMEGNRLTMQQNGGMDGGGS